MLHATRFLCGIAFFLVPIAICCLSSLGTPIRTWVPNGTAAAVLPLSSNETVVEQVITPNRNTISVLTAKIGTYGRVNDSDLTMELVEKSSGRVLTSAEVNVEALIDNVEHQIRFDPVPVTPGQEYLIRFTPANVTGENCVAFYRTEEGTSNSSGWAIVNGEQQDFNFCIKVYGK